MKNLFAKLRNIKYLLFNEQGIKASTSVAKKVVIGWNSVQKIIFTEYFEEYSGFFLTEEYLEKKLYHDIQIECIKNMVKIRTDSSPIIKNNISKPFSTKFGTTCIYNSVFVEYINTDGYKNIFGVHFDLDEKQAIIDKLKKYLSEDKIFEQKKIEGFNLLLAV